MSENLIIQIVEAYRQSHFLSPENPMNDRNRVIYLLVKGWLQYLPKEERVIFYERYIKNLSLHQINENLQKRWPLENARTEHELELRLTWANQRIVQLMNDHFSDYDFQLTLA